MMMVIMMMMIVKKITVTVKETSCIFAGGLAHRFHRYWLQASESAVGCLYQRGRTGCVSRSNYNAALPAY